MPVLYLIIPHLCENIVSCYFWWFSLSVRAVVVHVDVSACMQLYLHSISVGEYYLLLLSVVVVSAGCFITPEPLPLTSVSDLDHISRSQQWQFS